MSPITGTLMSIYKLYALLISATLCIGAVEHHANLSYSRQIIHILPELEVRAQGSLKRIIFLHIPKTAGTNVDNIAKACSMMTTAFHYQRLAIPRIPDCSPVQITEGWIGGWQQLVLNPHLFDILPESFFLTGHFPYGLHKHFSSSAKYITLVRNPLERELSTANFAYQRGYIQAEDFTCYLLEQMLDNPQVRLIAGKEAMTGPCTEETLNTAMRNIERDFLLAAPSEDVDTFLQLLASFQKWGPLAYAPMQITHEKAVKILDPLLVDTLLEKHRWDMRFYEWIKQRWNLCKRDMIISQKQHFPEQIVLTLMPDHLSSRQSQWLTIDDIEAHNRVYSAQELLELTQTGFAAPDSR
jgi:hypothetical protein